MDVFYYWKKFDQDMKEGRIGWLLSDRKKMGEMRAE